MCGIVGYLGKNNALPFILQGLEKLEYRGYDSAGVAFFNEGEIKQIKTKGRLSNLKGLISSDLSSEIGIGHTRWATHGAPSDKNSHPHLSQNGKFAVVHNGIIENYLELKKELEEKGYNFLSDTDSEVIPNLLEYFYDGDIIDAILQTVKKLKGSFALGIICAEQPHILYAVKKDSPLVVGIGEDEKYIASDIPALLFKTRKVYLLEECELAVMSQEDVKFYSFDKKEIKKEIFSVDWDINSAEKEGYDHFMLKEINEQPTVLANTLSAHVSGNEIIFNELDNIKDKLKNLNRIFITACGSAYHAGLAGKYVIEKLNKIPTDVWLASEFRYQEPVVTENDLVVVISQSGETADTLAALREAKRLGATTLAIVNVVGSSIAREADYTIYTIAGPEIAVATTKAYSCQLLMLDMLAIYLSQLSGKNNAELVNQLKLVPEKVKETIKLSESLKELAFSHKDITNAFYIGRGLDYSVSIEGSLKLKEISYIGSEAYAAGELKHGTISLIEENSLVLAVATQQHIYDKTISNIKEVKSRGGYVILFSPEGAEKSDVADKTVVLPKTADLLSPSITVVALQIFAYYVALAKELDIDKPRNLAKSVTVE